MQLCVIPWLKFNLQPEASSLISGKEPASPQVVWVPIQQLTMGCLSYTQICLEPTIDGYVKKLTWKQAPLRDQPPQHLWGDVSSSSWLQMPCPPPHWNVGISNMDWMKCEDVLLGIGKILMQAWVQFKICIKTGWNRRGLFFWIFYIHQHPKNIASECFM